MAAELRWILLTLCVPVLAAIWWWTARRSRQGSGNSDLKYTPPSSDALNEPTVRRESGESYRDSDVSRGWGVPPFEPLSIRTADFDAVPMADAPMSATTEPVEVTFELRDPLVHDFVELPIEAQPTIEDQPGSLEEPASEEAPAASRPWDAGAEPLGAPWEDVVAPHAHSAPPVTPPWEAAAASPGAAWEASGAPAATPPWETTTAPPPRTATAVGGAPPVERTSIAPAAPPPPPLSSPSEAANTSETQHIIGLRVCAKGGSRWPGSFLISALESHGLAYGRYKIFHRKHTDGRTLFCAASLIEPGTFDAARMPEEDFEGVALFAVLPGPADPRHTIETLIATAQNLADTLQGTVEDSQGAPLSPQRANALRADVARFHASLSPG